MHTKSRNIEIMKGDKTDEITKKLFESLLQNYNKTLEEAMRTSEFVTTLKKIDWKRVGSYIDML